MHAHNPAACTVLCVHMPSVWSRQLVCICTSSESGIILWYVVVLLRKPCNHFVAKETYVLSPKVVLITTYLGYISNYQGSHGLTICSQGNIVLHHEVANGAKRLCSFASA